MCPAIDEVIAVDRLAMKDGPAWRSAAAMLTLVRDIRRRKFDLVIDFHSFRETNLLTWLSGSKAAVGMKRHLAPYWAFCFTRPPVLEDKRLHVADMFQKVVEGVIGRPASKSGPILTLPESIGSKEPSVTFYVDAPVPERVWPPEFFARLADYVIEKLDASVLVVSGKEGADLAGRVHKASLHPGKLSLYTDVTVPELAALIASSRLLVSNDTGPMHLGPAVGVPTLGLFSVGYPEHFRPIGPNDRFLRANPIEGIQVSQVIEAVGEMWTTADLNLRR